MRLKLDLAHLDTAQLDAPEQIGLTIHFRSCVLRTPLLPLALSQAQLFQEYPCDLVACLGLQSFMDTFRHGCSLREKMFNSYLEEVLSSVVADVCLS